MEAFESAPSDAFLMHVFKDVHSESKLYTFEACENSRVASLSKLTRISCRCKREGQNTIN